MSTHIVSDVEAIASNIVFMNKGKILDKTTPKEILETMKGKVFIGIVFGEHFNEIKARYVISNALNKVEGVEITIVGERASEEFNQVEATLEDAYLYYYSQNK